MSKLKYYDGTNWKVVNGQITGDTLPIGAIVPFGGWDAPTGWLICNGTLLNKTAYPELFNAIGYSFGGEEGGSTFGLPDLRGRVPVGEKDNDSDFDGMGVTGGEKTHTLTINEMPSHNHGIKFDSNGAWGSGLPHIQDGSETTTNYSMTNSGGGQAHNNLQPYQVVCYIIKAKQSAGVVANVSKTYSTSEDDTYACSYVNEIKNTIDNTYGRHTLYTSSGGTSSTITLSESSSNYSYLEVYYYADARHDSVKIPTSASYFSLNLLYTNADNHNQYIYTTDCSLSGNQITQNVARNNFITSDNTISSYGNTPYIKVYKVIGYK